MSIQSASLWSSTISATTSLINTMSTAETNLGKGLASIANSQALKRVNSQLVADIQSVLGGSSTTSSTSSTSSSTTSSSSTGSATAAKPATGVGTVPVTTSTQLSTLGILPGGTIAFGDGSSTATAYTSTGNDTVGDLINAINNGSAFLSASINNKSELTVTARSSTGSVIITGSGTDASAIGFGTGNNTFQPTKATSPASSTSAGASSSSTHASTTSSTSSSTRSTSSSTSTSKSSSAVSSRLQENASSAASVLSASGVSGSLVDMLA